MRANPRCPITCLQSILSLERTAPSYATQRRSQHPLTNRFLACGKQSAGNRRCLLTGCPTRHAMSDALTKSPAQQDSKTTSHLNQASIDCMYKLRIDLTPAIIWVRVLIYPLPAASRLSKYHLVTADIATYCYGLDMEKRLCRFILTGLGVSIAKLLYARFVGPTNEFEWGNAVLFG